MLKRIFILGPQHNCDGGLQELLSSYNSPSTIVIGNGDSDFTPKELDILSTKGIAKNHRIDIFFHGNALKEKEESLDFDHYITTDADGKYIATKTFFKILGCVKEISEGI